MRQSEKSTEYAFVLIKLYTYAACICIGVMFL